MPKLTQMATCKCRMKARGPQLSLGGTLQQMEMLCGPVGKGWGDLGADPGPQPQLSPSCLLAPAADTSSFHPKPWAGGAEGNVDTA